MNGKPSSPVLRGLGASNGARLLDLWDYFLLARHPTESWWVKFDKASNDIGIVLHIELAIVFMCDSEAEALVEPQSGIDSYYIQAYCKIERSGFANQSLHHLRADAPALKRAVHKHLRDKKFIIFPDGLQQPTSAPSSTMIRTCIEFHCCLKLVS